MNRYNSHCLLKFLQVLYKHYQITINFSLGELKDVKVCREETVCFSGVIYSIRFINSTRKRVAIYLYSHLKIILDL